MTDLRQSNESARLTTCHSNRIAVKVLNFGQISKVTEARGAPVWPKRGDGGGMIEMRSGHWFDIRAEPHKRRCEAN